MPPQNNQSIPTPITPEGNEGVKVPETKIDQIPEKKPESVPVPLTPEKPVSEKFTDQTTQAPVSPAPITPPVLDEPVKTTPAQVPVSEDDEAAAGVSEMDKAWVQAVDSVVENDKDKPYEEEEDSEKLQIDYLAKRFSKKIDKE